MNETDQSIIFAGHVPEGAYVRLMKANFDRLVDGASYAAQSSYETVGATSPELAILISCVGRKLVLKQRIEEEIESVQEVLGEQAVFTGFYSNGEIAPFDLNAQSELHNQTMLIPISDTVVVMPLIGTMDARRTEQVLETLLHGLSDSQANIAILDITGVGVVDTQVAQGLIRAAHAAQLLGARVVLTGIRPEIAQTLVGLGIDLSTIVTHSTLQNGIASVMK